MEINTIEANNSFFKTKIIIDKKTLVFPTQKTLITLILPLVLSLLVYAFFVIFPTNNFLSIIKPLYTLELSIFLGTILVLFIMLYWYCNKSSGLPFTNRLYWGNHFLESRISHNKVSKEFRQR